MSGVPSPTSRLRLVPVSFAQANEFVAAWHRHNDPMPGAKFSVGVADELEVLHVRPPAWKLDFVPCNSTLNAWRRDHPCKVRAAQNQDTERGDA